MNITENFTYIGTSQNFERDNYATLAEMKAVVDKRMPDIFTATCKETGKLYIYNKNNEIDETLGKWREVEGDSPNIDSISVNGTPIQPDENKNIDIAIPDAYDDTDIKAELAKKADITSIPSKVSELTNDSNYQTAEQVNNAVTAEIAKVVANAPEDFDTLKEMSDWVAGHENDASAMNSAISDNKTAITALQSGKADKSEIPTTVAELTDSADYAKKSDVPTTLPANGGNADTVNNHTVESNVPADAVFTDTTYESVTQTENGLMSAADKAKLDGVEEGATKTLIDIGLSSTSTNPVQNKVVTDALNNKADKSKYSDTTINVGRKANTTVGVYSTAEGYSTTASGASSHAEGKYTTASGDYCSHAEGNSTTASGDYSHAEGFQTTASGESSHTEGGHTTASGASSHAEGKYTTASGNYSHAEGSKYSSSNAKLPDRTTTVSNVSYTISGSTAYGISSHAEGTQSFAYAYSSHAEGYRATASGDSSHAEGSNTIANGETQHVQGKYNIADETSAFIIGNGSGDNARSNAMKVDWSGNLEVAGNLKDGSGNTLNNMMSKTNPTGTGSFSLNRKADTTIGNYSFAEGNDTTASGDYSHAEGQGTIASASYTHSEGVNTSAIGQGSHAEGSNLEKNRYNEIVFEVPRQVEWDDGNDYVNITVVGSQAFGLNSHAEGCSTLAYGKNSHTEGYHTLAQTSESHAEGCQSIASGKFAHAEGYETTAIGDSSHTEGYHTTAANYASHASGKYNAAMTKGGASGNTTGTAFVIGNGTGTSALSNAFSVQYSGIVKAKSTITASTTADYAEFFEWLDKNPNEEDRVGHFVTLDGDKIKIATSEDDYILGIVSGEPFVLGNGDCDTWNGMYLHDEFRRTMYEPAPKIIEILDNEGNPTGEYEEVEGEYEGTRPILNPDYDPTQEYISRFDRVEWSPIGMLGVLAVLHDGTAEVNGYVTVNNEGIATKCTRDIRNSYRVIKKVSDKVVEVIFR